MSLNAQVRLMSSLGPSASSYMNEFNILLDLPLSVAPYSIVPSALADGLWSLICSFSIYLGKGVFINGSLSSHHLMLGHVAQAGWPRFWTKASLRSPCTFVL